MKRFVVVGAQKNGIGQAIAQHLIDKGHEVRGVNTQPDRDIAGMPATDLSDGSQLAAACAEVSVGEIHGVILADFIFAMEDPNNFDHELWTRVVAANLIAPAVVYHSLKDRMLPGASVVFVTSTEGFTGSFGASAYAASKAGVHNLVKSLANIAGPRGIRVNALATGWIGGVMDTDDVFNMSRSITPLARLGSPAEVAAAAAFLLSDDASFVNGAVVTVDGGYSGVDTIAKYEFEVSQ